MFSECHNIMILSGVVGSFYGASMAAEYGMCIFEGIFIGAGFAMSLEAIITDKKESTDDLFYVNISHA